jgi:hypothetical protein
MAASVVSGADAPLSALAPTAPQAGLLAPWTGAFSITGRHQDDLVIEQAFLTAAESATVRQMVFDLRGAWRTLSDVTQMHTLGYASYIDATTDATRPYYYEGCLSTNVILRQRLNWLYGRLMDRLKSALGAPVRFRTRCAVPGFHIFLGGADVTEYPASIHVDRQYRNLLWKDAESADFGRTISFTLSIALPRSGAGLRVWTQELTQDVKVDKRDEFLAAYTKLPFELHPYTEGNLVVHSGNLVHQIATGPRTEGSNRITLQGHGVFCDGIWQIYW